MQKDEWQKEHKREEKTRFIAYFVFKIKFWCILLYSFSQFEIIIKKYCNFSNNNHVMLHFGNCQWFY